MRHKRIKYLLAALVFLYTICSYLGLSDYVHSKSFENFDYPLNVDIKPLIEEVLSGKLPSVKPINYYPYRFLTNSGKCSTVNKLHLFIVVKSAMNHFEQRMAIRQTYGQEDVKLGYATKILFFLGTDGRKSEKSDTQTIIESEMIKYKDIIQIDFLDTYYNNTIKTMMSFRWLFEHCSEADFYLFTDDDMYISVVNLLDYLNTASSNGSAVTPKDLFYAGYMFKSAPHRIIGSKWRVGLEEYPWNKWPPYVTAGAYVMSNQAMKVIYVASLFVKHFRFDDIYLGIVAKKAGIVPVHSNRFLFHKLKYTQKGYVDVIACHGYGNQHELIAVWNKQHSYILSY